MFCVPALPPDTSPWGNRILMAALDATIPPNHPRQHDLMETVRSWAEEAERIVPTVPLLPAGQGGVVSLTRRQIRSLLALSLYIPLQVPDKQDVEGMAPRNRSSPAVYGTLGWEKLMNRTPGHEDKHVAVQRLRCLLHYFLKSLDNDSPETLAEMVEYERVHGTSPDSELSAASDTSAVIPLCDVEFTGDTRIEDVPEATVNVDFANKQLSLGIIPSCTQEEILFTMRPELYVSILLFATLQSNEVALFRNCRRVLRYKGYLNSFEFDGDYEAMPGEVVPEVVAIDAVVNFGGFAEVSNGAIHRDIYKAYAAFRAAKGCHISTGNWGCGAFGGTLELKFVQQVLAASQCGKKLYYSAFHPVSQQKVKKLYDGFVERGVTVQQLWKVLQDYDVGTRRPIATVLLECGKENQK